MVCKWTAAVFIFLLVVAPLVHGDLTKSDIDRALDIPALKHPYLYFTDEDKPLILERIKNHPDLNGILTEQIDRAKRLLEVTVDPVPPARSTQPRYDTSYLYEQYIGSNTASAFNLALVYQVTGDEKYAKKAFEFIKVVCDIPTWIHIVHEFDTIYDRVWPWGVKDDQVVFSYSQHTDHAVFQIAAIYDWLYPVLTKRQRDHIRGALLEKAILRVRGNYEYHWWATAYRCNWCAVCNSSIGVAAIALLTEDPLLTDVIAESYNRISKTLDEIKDGGWQEGIGYLNYTVMTSLRFADVLKRVTGGTLNLYRHPRFDSAIKTFLYCQIPPDNSVHFGDSGGGRVGSYTMFNELMLEAGNRMAAWLRKHIIGDRPSSIDDFFKPVSSLALSIPEETSIQFHSVDWVIMRSDFTDTEKFVVAGKCGKNDDPHHGHLDVGHFSLYWRGQEFICDHGSAGYDRRYFDKERWDYPLAATMGHNTVMVNGEQQLACKLKDQPWNYNIGGRVIEFRSGSDRDYALMDPTNAYPGKELKSWRRHLILDKPVITVVLDEVESKMDAEIEVRFHSSAAQETKTGYTILNGDKGIMAVIPVVEGDFRLRPGEHVFTMEIKGAKEQRVSYFGTLVKATMSKTVIGTIILPVDDKTEAQEIAESVKRTVDRSGNQTLSFTKNKKSYSFNFIREKEGLVLTK